MSARLVPVTARPLAAAAAAALISTLAAAVLLFLPATGSAAATDDPTVAPFMVTDAQFRWGINNESNNRAFAPGTFNFLSAGELPDPGSGGQTISLTTGAWSSGPAAWRASDGAVRIEKRNATGGFDLATLDGLNKDAGGVVISSPTSNTFTGHQVVIDGGTGQVDPAAGTATVSWKGTFSVAYYSGMSFFYVSDPQLSITPAGAVVTATLGGYRSDMDDASTWVRTEPQVVTLADLPRAEVPLDATGGFEVTPAYRGVAFDAATDGTPQVRTGDSWGSFPASFVSTVSSMGSGSYWYSSGGSADQHKVALPLTVSYSSTTPIVSTPTSTPTTKASATPTAPTAPSAPVAPTAKGTKKPTPTPSATTSTTAKPTPTTATTSTGVSDATPSDTSLLTTAAPDGSTALLLDESAVSALADPSYDPRPPEVPVVYALTAADQQSAPMNPSQPWEWLLGALLLLGAAVISLLGSFAKGKR